ncbi:Tol-Pal system beta propeller repeat protein TolB [Piscinibacter sakaiensis]|uniref:Tol-Pal system beta propeller repeat protein TolB n=1 Tax=Piscinibacter sakaiensis TaxID=1547922 RepID=UPI003AADBDA8
MLTRRFVTGALTGGALLAAMRPALAQFRVEISGVGATQLPIAIARFRDEDKTNQILSSIIRADLERSGVFRGQDVTAVIDEMAQPPMAEWRGRAVDALVGGSVTRLADGRFDVRFKLWDTVKGVEIGGQSTAVVAADLRLAAHRIADYVFEKLTGDKGVFATRMAYVTKGGGRYTLRVADADGEAAQVALNSPEPIISPAWSPDGKELAYVSFEQQKAVVWVQDVLSGARRKIADFRGSNSAPAWSLDGKQLAVTLSRDGGSQLYLIGSHGGNAQRLTTSSAIDTEPVFAPDGRIYFVSDRGGGPQIYRMPGGGGPAERVTFVGGYNVSPSISADGRYMAYVSQQGRSFKLQILDLLSGGPPRSLTDSDADESPSFAPNGKLLVYATKAGGRDVLMTTTVDGRIKARLLSSTADVREPAWGPYGR